MELQIAEILKKVQTIQLVANRTVDDLFAGQYRSIFRGRGMEFDEVREYQPGDDIRTIDWNVTARTGTPYVKRFCEERELTVQFLVDVSASGAFGSRDRSKLELLTEVAALLMFSALKNNDKVGLILFCDEVLQYFPPRKGKANVLRLVREIVSLEPVTRTTRIESAVDFLNRVQRRKSVVFLLSDFLAETPRRELAMASRRHDVTAITVSDPRELSVPDVGFVRLIDAETGEIVEVDTHHPDSRQFFHRRSMERSARTSQLLRRAGVDELPLSTAEDTVQSIQRFFRMRERRLATR